VKGCSAKPAAHTFRQPAHSLTYLDVTHPEANKGEVVLSLSRLLNIPTAEIATIGDMPNDVLMFKKSGMSIVMGNASPEVQAAATCVTSTNEDEGFAKGIEKFVLNSRRRKRVKASGLLHCLRGGLDCRRRSGQVMSMQEIPLQPDFSSEQRQMIGGGASNRIRDEGDC